MLTEKATVVETYKEISKFVSLALSVNPNTKTDGYLEAAWELLQKLPDKNKRGLRAEYPGIYEAITSGINPSPIFLEALKDELAELKLTTNEDVATIEKSMD